MEMLAKRTMTVTGLALLFLAPIITALVAPAARAQVPNIGDAIKQSTPPPNEARPAPPPEKPIIMQEEKPFSLPEGEKILVNRFVLEGAPKAEEAALSAILESYRGKELAMAEITEAVNKLTLHLRDKGYLVAQALVPKQDATSGILTIRIVLGTYGKFSLKNTSHVRDFLLDGVFDRAKGASPVVTAQSIERAIMLVREMPGARLPTVTVAPGQAPGSSDFDVNVEAGPRFDGYIMADNQGSKYTGRNRFFGGLNVNSPFGTADRFSVSGMTTDETRDLQNVRLAYGFPLTYSGLRAELAASRTTYQLGGDYDVLDATGSADVLEGTFSYPLQRTHDVSMDFLLNLAYKKLKDDLGTFDLENPRHISVATLSFSRSRYGKLFGLPLFTTISAGVDLGRLSFEDDAQQTMNEAGANTAGTYSKATLTLSGEVLFTGKLSLKGGIKLQKSFSGNLDPTEQLFISGTTGVKTYTEGISFDNGYVANAELRYSLPTLFGVKHSLGLFADNGYVYAQNGDYTTNDRITLTDAGLGYYLSFKQFFGTAQVAKPIGRSRGNIIESDPGTRVLGQIGFTF
jgi:hemolysin activation/secretion protein